jgi:hypothetical protein
MLSSGLLDTDHCVVDDPSFSKNGIVGTDHGFSAVAASEALTIWPKRLAPRVPADQLSRSGVWSVWLGFLPFDPRFSTRSQGA